MTVTDENSVARLLAPYGMTLWTVDDISQLCKQAFWFRAGTSETSISVYSLPLLSVTSSTPNQLTTVSTDRQLTFTINYTLDGGPVGSGTSRLLETITIANCTTKPLNFRFFQYTDLDLNGSMGGDTLQLERSGGLFTSATQSDSGVVGRETLSTPANHGEAGSSDALLSKLQDRGALTLLDNSDLLDAGDRAFLLEWDAASLAPRGTFTIQLEKEISGILAVPEPSSACFLVLAISGLMLRSRARKGSVSRS
jgi:hypothetical protein